MSLANNTQRRFVTKIHKQNTQIATDEFWALKVPKREIFNGVFFA
jgi:isocitrate/isopropylmalate dehydrogenase